MKIHNVPQRTPEWLEARKGIFTASEFGPWCLEPMVVAMTVKEISKELERLGIDHKKNGSRDTLLDLLPSLEPYKTLSQGAKTAIIANYVSTMEKDEWQLALERKQELSFEYNIPVQRGNVLESEAKFFYHGHTGNAVHDIGFITHDDGGFGCSPDGLIIGENPANWSHGIEIKCPMPEKHIADLLNGTLPDDHKYQVHGSMAVTGLDRWDFLSYCPGETPLLITVNRDEFTEHLLRGLKEVVRQKALMKAKLRDIWTKFHTSPTNTPT